ncbi:helix-turn-helix transcriptional regulator [Parasphingorhabdus sp.]|uniref:helix-turn-helix transcriptional regulator n=2 Tax=Parasphingorhabdus sp. TaxID=2709688 RepID=UPI003D273DD2
MTFEHNLLQLGRISSPARLWAFAINVGTVAGFQSAIYACPPPHKKPTDPDTIVRYRGMSDAEFQKFAVDGLIGQGHLTNANSLINAKPFRWTDLAELTSEKSEFLHLKAEANSVGIDDGWIFPLFGPRGRDGLASFGKPNHPDLMTNEVGEKLQIFAQMSHIRLCQLTPDLFEIEKPLSKREMQIVAWVAVGKSNSEISSILGISENSIDTYMRRAFLKLDVHDRTSAAVKAISMDIVRT